ncbi:MAG: aminoglycoside 6-adenylyltransferase [Chloroflexi bacterium]|nr:aminoglycoside 6-adenylyltransferase [Chloroflexota bacterium]
MDIKTYDNFTNRLLENLRDDKRVLGVVALGSMANVVRRDQYSDHDFFVIVQPSTQSFFRGQLDWLPDSDSIVLQFQETAHGLKVMYDSGHLIEFAVFDLDELMISKANDYRILLDKADIANRMQQVVSHSTPPQYNYLNEFLHFLSLLQVGAGRYWRGEQLSGHLFIKSHALQHLLPVLTHYLPADNQHKLDNLDSFRRFEQVYPEIGQALAKALLKSPPDAALEMLTVCEEYVKPLMIDYPQWAVDTLRRYFTESYGSQKKG